MLKLFTIITSLLSLASVGLSPTEVIARNETISHQTITETGYFNSEGVYINNIDNPSSIEKIQSEVAAFDFEDGDLTHEIYVVFDNYTDNMNKLGEFLLVFGVTDSGGAETTLAVTVKNVDVLAPTFTVEVESTLEIPQYSVLAANLPNITAYDSFEGDLTPDIKITGLEFIDTDVLGEYSLLYTVSDSTGNQTTETFIVKVVDSTNPEITGPNEIIKRADTILDGSFYLRYFSATDDHDGIISNRLEVITDGYMGNANNPGTYTVVISVSDTQGNYINHTLKVIVVKDMLPRLIIDQYYWVVGDNHKIIDDEFIDTLKFIGDLPNYTYIFNTSYDNYTNSYSSLDTYQKNFDLKSSTGEEFEREIILEVVDSGANIVDQDPGFIETNSGIIVGAIATAGLLTLFVVGLLASKK